MLTVHPAGDLVVLAVDSPGVDEVGAMFPCCHLPAVAENRGGGPAGRGTDPLEMGTGGQRRGRGGFSYIDAPVRVELGRDIDGDPGQDVLVFPAETSNAEPVPGQDEPVPPVHVEPFLLQPAARAGGLLRLFIAKVPRMRKDESSYAHSVPARWDLLDGELLDPPPVPQEWIPRLHRVAVD